ncbi:alpha-mannosyltransferase [Pseudomonas alcaligenes]|uniref:Alpha-mannosyltransferase n=1 Tax=Aquipseudomonas alcaligenes TaxID=43263 RepID=A0ABR7RZ01_AQUAC|nr:glycosyltransferase family 1 protein [Pseudomonas alcaligenes]MBC9250024.1 alpha-mannosyltransferase [Pseudomonas alcaligenes]
MRILIVSDAWHPQVNGVVTSLQALVSELRGLGHLVKLLSPQDFHALPCPSYPEIPLVWDLWKVGPAIRAFGPDCVHLATEGPLGWAARRWLGKRGLAFSSAIHTRFPEYVHTRWPALPLSWGYAYLRRFHQPSQAVLVTTERLRDEFSSWGLQRLQLWRKGVDTRLFQPQGEAPVEPLFLYVGRLAAEKNVAAFLALDLPGLKCVVGDGPQRGELQAAYPQTQFLGYLQGEALAQAFAAASVLVFPSRTDTYGLVMLEALACGTPVAAFPVPGPLDVLEAGVTGVMSEDLRQACLDALQLDRRLCAERAARQSWRASALEFLSQQPLLDGELVAPAELQALRV